MKSRLLALVFFAGSSLFAGTHISIGVGIGGYGPGYYVAAPPPPPVVAYAPRCPGPGYSWIAGYWYPVRGRYYWRAGYWARPPYGRRVWVRPRYHGHRYYRGYWRR